MSGGVKAEGFRAFRELSVYKWHFVGLIALSALEVALRVALPWPMKAVVDHALGGVPPPESMSYWVGPTRTSWLRFAIVAGIGLQVLHQSVLMAHTILYTQTGHLLTRDLRQRLFSHLQALGLRYHSRMPVGEAAYRLQTDATYLDQLLVRGIVPLAFSGITLVVMFGVLVEVDPPLALASLSIVPFMFLWIRWSARRIRPRAEHTHVVESRLTARLHESFAAIRLVKSFAREPYETSRLAAVADEAMQARVVLSVRQAWFSLVVGSLIVLGTSLVLFVGGRQVLRGEVTTGTLLVALAYLGFVYGPLAGIATTIGTIQEALASRRRVAEAFALAPEFGEGSRTVPRLEGRITFEHVSFAYDGRPVLADVSFTLKPGEMIALVGPSGSGKTTLASLIPRFHDPIRGRILLDGVDVREYRLSWLRQQIALVLQEPIVLAGSIRDNLRYGRLDADDEAIEQAARAAHAHDFILQQAHGYETALSEAGGGLSGGEKQRLSIARAFLKDAPILILDEPTSALDARSEGHVVAAVEALRQRRSTLVIAHRLSTVRAADRILVLDAGRLVADGAHDELLATSQLYRQLAAQLAHGPDEPPASPVEPGQPALPAPPGRPTP